MTLENYFKQQLFENGMFEQQAQEVMEMAKLSESLHSMEDRWGDNVSGYQKELLTACWVSIKLTAVQWIDKNLPMAWYRPVFAE